MYLLIIYITTVLLNITSFIFCTDAAGLAHITSLFSVFISQNFGNLDERRKKYSLEIETGCKEVYKSLDHDDLIKGFNFPICLASYDEAMILILLSPLMVTPW